MISVKTEIAGAKKLAEALRAVSREENKALNTAIRVTGYRKMRKLQKEIEAGAPGGRPFAPLTLMARKRGGRTSRKPLRSLAVAVKYRVKKEPFTFTFGFVGPDRRDIKGDAREKDRISKSWKHLAEIHQKGFSRTPMPKYRGYLAGYGGRLSKRSKFRRVFFLRKETRQFHTPARPIVDPFWAAHKRDVFASIRRDYRRKLRGERI